MVIGLSQKADLCLDLKPELFDWLWKGNMDYKFMHFVRVVDDWLSFVEAMCRTIRMLNL